MTKPNVLDHTQDLSGADQHRLINLFPPPDFVKQAAHEQLYGDPEKLAPHVYAYESQRTYPCHTKAATWMSALFFADKRDTLPPAVVPQIADRILKTAAYWKIQPGVEELWEKVAAAKKSGEADLRDDQFALVWEHAGRRERHYPVRTPAEVKLASEWFGKYHNDFVFADKHKIASKILAKADEFQAPVENQELLHKCAGYGYCSKQDTANAWVKRADLAHRQHPQYAIEARNMAEVVRTATLDARDHSRRVKMAELLDQFDRQTNLHRLYDDGGLERPEDICFSITEKVASDFANSHVQTTTGAVYEKSALAALDLDTVRSWFGDDIAEACGPLELDVEKLASIIPTLPRPDAQAFERMATSAGVSVAAREKSAADQGMTLDELHEFAQRYGQQDALQPTAAGVI